MAASIVRIQKEYKEVREAKDGSGITAELVDSTVHPLEGNHQRTRQSPTLPPLHTAPSHPP